jgi:hypothetical protein
VNQGDRLHGDPLEPLAEVTAADPRCAGFGFFGTPPIYRKKCLEDQHAEAAAQELIETTPRDVWQHFETARTVYVYSFFSYRLHHVADMHALASLEFALKTRFAQQGRNLAPLLKRGIDEGLLLDSGMRLWARRESARERQCRDEAEWPEELRKLFGTAQSSPFVRDNQSYVRHLGRELPKFRNDLAHGSTYLYPQGALILELCCDLINQLFEPGTRTETDSI